MCQVNAKTQPASSPQHRARDPTYQAPNMPVSSRGSGAGVVIHEVSVPPRRIWAGLGWATSILEGGDGGRKDVSFPPPSLPSSC